MRLVFFTLAALFLTDTNAQSELYVGLRSLSYNIDLRGNVSLHGIYFQNNSDQRTRILPSVGFTRFFGEKSLIGVGIDATYSHAEYDIYYGGGFAGQAARKAEMTMIPVALTASYRLGERFSIGVVGSIVILSDFESTEFNHDPPNENLRFLEGSNEQFGLGATVAYRLGQVELRARYIHGLGYRDGDSVHSNERWSYDYFISPFSTLEFAVHYVFSLGKK